MKIDEFDALILANGQNAPLPWQNYQYRHFVCTDGAVLSLTPPLPKIDYIIGDLDSVFESASFSHIQQLKDHFSQTSVIQIDEQNTTDLEKALLFAQSKQWQRILCLGVFGKAVDHTLYNLHLISHFSQFMQIFGVSYFDQLQQWVFALPKNIKLSAPIGSVLSLCTLTQATVSSQGLKWELERYPMNGLTKSSMRNQINAPSVTLTCQGQCLAFLSTTQKPIFVD